MAGPQIRNPVYTVQRKKSLALVGNVDENDGQSMVSHHRMDPNQDQKTSRASQETAELEREALSKILVR